MSRLYSIILAFVLMLVGFVMTNIVLLVLGVEVRGDWWGIATAIAVGIVEITVLRYLPDRLKRLSQLDGDIFPFLSVGAGVAMTGRF